MPISRVWTGLQHGAGGDGVQGEVSSQRLSSLPEPQAQLVVGIRMTWSREARLNRIILYAPNF